MTATIPEIDELEKLYDESNERCQSRAGLQKPDDNVPGELCPNVAVVRIKIFCDCPSVRTGLLCKFHFDALNMNAQMRCTFCGKAGHFDWTVI